MFCNIFMLEFKEEEGGQIDSQKFYNINLEQNENYSFIN